MDWLKILKALAGLPPETMKDLIALLPDLMATVNRVMDFLEKHPEVVTALTTKA